MKNILIPTDFSTASLNLLKRALENESDSINIYLVHAVSLPTSITDLLFFSKKKLLTKYENKNFLEAVSILENKYSSKINFIKTDLVIGNSKNAVDNYLKANNISCVYVPKNISALAKSKKNSLNIIPALKRCPVKITKVDYMPVTQEENISILSKILT